MSLDNTYTDRELLQQVASGDVVAFRQLFDLYRMRLFSFVLKMTHSAADAEEIVQEVFTKLWTNRDSLPAVEFPGKYIYTIARNKTLNHLARAARDQQLQQQLWINLSPYHNTTEDLLQAQESQRLINEAINLLSPQRQTIFRLSREQGLTHEEIAARLGLSKSRIKNILVEILKHIKEQLVRYSAILPILFWF
ncbi:RNA polymerase subunit sigma-70 [Niastella vici]|uniref:RNA polymerase subunit sigma-70 n=1 Tax=Niastella vici TaxID=1703345 RepID=A0A1V9FQA4_9BACT|nr:RNA polymerase sigma-70 factor [Niastella vici]OQP60559.1 RNA polymerase subunit sigma-70 [Niastella vici]